MSPHASLLRTSSDHRFSVGLTPICPSWSLLAPLSLWSWPLSSIVLHNGAGPQVCHGRDLITRLASVLHALANRTMRNHELLRRIDGISRKMPIPTLRNLERNREIKRHAYPEALAHVKYRLAYVSYGCYSRRRLRSLPPWMNS